MGFLLSIFSSKTTWMLIVAAVIAGIIGVQQARISYLKNKVEDKEAAIAAAMAELKQAQSLVMQFKNAVDGLEDTVDRQNTEIAKLETAVAVRIAKAKEAMKIAEIERAKANSLADTLSLMELSKDECKAMASLVDAYGNSLQ